MKCGQKTCDQEAVTAFIWPGAGVTASCVFHALTAYELAKHFAFTLHVSYHLLEDLEIHYAKEVTKHVKVT